jgi:hypothetical protein
MVAEHDPKEFEFLMTKYEHVFDLFKLDLNIAHRNFQLFIGIQSALIGFWAYGFNKYSSDILLWAPVIGLTTALIQRRLHLKSRMFGEFRKRHMRDVEKELKEKCSFNLDIFTFDKEVFGPKHTNYHKFAHSKERFPPEDKDWEKIYNKFGRKSLMKYQEYIYTFTFFLWPVLIFFLLWPVIFRHL